jgi:hypothetical protein
VGSSGIRRRKPAHHLPKSHEHYTTEDAAGAFGNFRWSAYSPAGAVERARFITRQTLRSRRHPEWNEYHRKTKLVGEALLVIPYLALLVIGIGALVERLFGG